MATFSEIAERIFSGITPLAKGDAYVEPPQGIRFLRSGEITSEGNVTAESEVHISESIHDGMMKRSQLEKGDLLIAIVGATIGSAGIYDRSEPANINQAIAAVRLGDAGVSREFACWYLHSHLGQRLLDFFKRPVARANINLEEVGEIPLLIPNAKKQRELVAAMDAARAERRAKLAEADALLAGLDGFLLATLGLTPPPKDDRKVFAATLASVRGRADADFHSPRFRAIREGIEAGKYPARPLTELCSRFESGFAAGRQDQAFDYTLGVPHLRPLNLNAQGEISLENTKFVPKSSVQPRDYCERGEVLFNNTNSAEMVGKSTVFEFEQPCACSNHMTRLRVREGNRAHYLAAIFNMLRRLGYLGLLATKFNNQAGINLDTLTPLRVPAPPPAVQETIATEARRRREAARRLRAEAETGWQSAKCWFEAQLLGA